MSAAATDRATRDARDKHAPMGRAARAVEGRVLASSGLLTEAAPVFAEPATAVAYGGVLAALPNMLRQYTTTALAAPSGRSLNSRRSRSSRNGRGFG